MDSLTEPKRRLKVSLCQPAGRRGLKEYLVSLSETDRSRKPANPYTTASQLPAIAAVWMPSLLFPCMSSRSMRTVFMKYSYAALSSPVSEAMMLWIQCESEESPVVRGS